MQNETTVPLVIHKLYEVKEKNYFTRTTEYNIIVSK